MTTGVYRIVCKTTGQFYLGSSINCPRRFWEHRSELRNGNHSNPALQAEWDRQGPEAFNFEIVKACSSRDEAFDEEEKLLREFCGTANCLNVSVDARVPFRDPVVKALSKQAINTSEHYKEVHRRVCVERNADPEFQKRATAAAKASPNFQALSAIKAARLQRPDVVAKNREALRNSEKQKSSARLQAAILNTPEMRARNRAAVCRAVTGIHSETGEKIEFDSVSDAARHLGIYTSHLSTCCRNPRLKAKGYRWNYANPPTTGSPMT